MIRKPVVLTVIGMAVLALVGVAALAVGPNSGYVFSDDGRTITATKPPHTIPAEFRDPTLKTIAGNLSTYPFATFFCCSGYTVAQGAPNVFPFQTWVAVPFTPTANATVTRIEAAVGIWFGRTGGFEFSIREDNAGIPGKVLKSFHVPAPFVYGSCCVLDTFNDKAGIPVTAGTQYWLAATTTAKETNFVGGWATTSIDMRSHTLAGWCKGSENLCNGNSGKWVVGSGVLPMPAYAVFGH